jgi:hypothetical protein
MNQMNFLLSRASGNGAGDRERRRRGEIKRDGEAVCHAVYWNEAG